MRSGWFFGTDRWNAYLQEYAKTRPQCLNEWKSSPLANDHDFTEALATSNCDWTFEEHLTQVIDLRTHKWSDVRKSYHSLIHRATEKYSITEDDSIFPFVITHHAAFGNVRNGQTFAMQKEWLKSGCAISVSAAEVSRLGHARHVGVVLWIIYQSNAYFASSPSTVRNVQHAIIWRSFDILRKRGVVLVDMGQIDGETEKERNIGMFKAGFGGEAKPFAIVRRKV